jgi:hypothetical protein
MLNFLLLAVAFGSPIDPPAKPAYFRFDVEARTPYSLFINGDPIEANTNYKTEPLDEPVCVEVEIRYVSGCELVKRKFFVDLKPGQTCYMKITLSATPLYAWC